MAYNYDTFQAILEKWNCDFTEEKKNQLTTYYEMLVEKNKVMNLTGITEFSEVLEKHFLDSISLCNYVDFNKSVSVIDLGTGAGFPGLPLKILFPEIHMTLADSLNKRILFLNEVIEEIGLHNIETVHGRAEDLGFQEEYRESFDYCVSRAVANLASLTEYCLPFVKIGGQFISYKSGEIEEELAGCKKAVHVLGGKIQTVHQFQLEGTDLSRSFVCIDKITKTPKKYPRKAGTPTKSPIV